MHPVDSLTTPILAARIADLQKANQLQPVTPVIPKPKGSSYSLQRMMGLEDDAVKYDEIRVRPHSPFLPSPSFIEAQGIWKKLIRVAAFEDGVMFAYQPKEKIVKFAKKVCVSFVFTSWHQSPHTLKGTSYGPIPPPLQS